MRDLMPGFGDHSCLVGEALNRMTRNEPTGLEIVFVEKLQQARRACFACPHPTLDIRG
jgi:hypothetical protein